MTQQTYGEWMRSNPPLPTLTAVEWYYEQIVVKGKTNYYELLEQAKQMEKEQIVEAFYEGMKTNPFDPNRGRGTMYYNETYGKPV